MGLVTERTERQAQRMIVCTIGCQRREPLYPEAAPELCAFCDIAKYLLQAVRPFLKGGLRCVFTLHTTPRLLAFAPLQMLPRAAGKQAGGQTTVRAEPVTTTLDSNITDTYTAELMRPLQQPKSDKVTAVWHGQMQSMCLHGRCCYVHPWMSCC